MDSNTGLKPPMGGHVHQSLSRLRERVEHILASRGSRFRTLDMLMEWLKEQIREETLSQDVTIMQEFSVLLRVSQGVDDPNFLEEFVDKAFRDSLEKDAAQNPAYRRRCLMYQQDIRQMIQAIQSGSLPRPPASSSSGDLHYHSQLLSSSNELGALPFQDDTNIHPEAVTGRGPQKTKSNCIPLGIRKPSASAANQADISTTESLIFGQANGMAAFDGAVPESQAPSSTTSGLDDMMTTSGPIRSLEEMDRKQKKPGPTGRPDLTVPPHKGYICKRCKESGHWIQLCPTNMDPRYDTPPTEDYICHLCGLWGDHFSTLCPLNRKDHSLTQQRRAAASKQTASSPDGERSRLRRRSPSVQYRQLSRSRSPIPARRRLRHISRDADSSSQTSHGHREGRGRRQVDEDLPAATTRSRKAREIERRRENRSASPRYRHSDYYRPGDRSRSPLRARPQQAKATRKESKKDRDLDRVKKEPHDEGRLRYDDDVFNKDHFLHTPKKFTAVGAGETPDMKDAPMTDAPPMMQDSPEDIEMGKIQADDFIAKLSSELQHPAGAVAWPEANVAGATTGAFEGSDTPLHDPMSLDSSTSESDHDEMLNDPSYVRNSEGILLRMVSQAFFRPEVVRMFRFRENPVIHSRAKRKTAAEMNEMAPSYYKPAPAAPSEPASDPTPIGSMRRLSLIVKNASPSGCDRLTRE
ncbi:hypothetical protein GGR56DRAFT_325409 [Xylariaceae sp. FL0804]|nr:hypothetical protein GGR56DRAFT_325409 [Xylariaceae sp. FL0804]